MMSSRKKYIMGGVAVALAGVLTVGGIVSRINNVEVAASPSLDGIEEIISKNSAEKPFTILEIVPSASVTVSEASAPDGQLRLSTGTVGWLISGNEPMRPELTLQQLSNSDDRKAFMLKVKTMLEQTGLINGTASSALSWTDYKEISPDVWAALPDDQRAEYGRFTTDGAQKLSGVMTFDGTLSGNYVKRYANPSADGSENTVAADFFDKGVSSNLMKCPSPYGHGDGDFDPNFILDSRSEAGTGLYFVEFFAQSGLKKGAFRVAQEREYTIDVGAPWGSLALAQNTILYQKDDEGRFHTPQYIYKDSDGKIQLNSKPVDVDPFDYTADGRDVIFKSMKRYASENPTDPEYEETDPAGDVIDAPDESESGNEAPGDPETPEDTEETVEPEYPEEPEQPAGAEQTLYTVVFEYTENMIGDTEQLYTISDYTRMPETTSPEMRGIPYKIMTSEPLVSNYARNGIITHVMDMDQQPWIVFERTDGGNYSLSAGDTIFYYIKGIDIYYTGGFINNDWFKSWVFDLDDSQEARDRMKIEVYTISAGSVTISDIENADLIYLSEGNRGLVADKGFMPEYSDLDIPVYSQTADISKEVSTTFLYQVTMRNKPVMTDYEFVKKTDTATRATYAWKAAYVLAADDIRGAYNRYVSSFTIDGIDQMEDDDHTWVNKNVYIFNDFNEVNGGRTILNDNFINEKAGTAHIDGGFQEVKKRIEDTNAERSGKPGREIKNTKIDEATIIRHILDYSKVKPYATKEDIYILELEPTNMGLKGYYDSQWGGDKNVEIRYDLSVKEETVGNTKTSTLQYCKYDDSDGGSTKPVVEDLPITTTGTIHLVQMGTPEFIGKIDDLNSTYDMIFIGDDTSGMNHQGRALNSGTKFNDATMNNMIYTNVGDYGYVTRDRLLGSLESEYKDGVVTHNKNHLYGEGDFRAEDPSKPNYPDNTIGRTRLAGNDIRKSDIDYFYNFALADYPIVFATNLINEDSAGKRTVNEKYVDNTSHMCEMMEKLLGNSGTADNVFTIKDLTDDKSDAAKARRKKLEESLGILKPEIVFIDPNLKNGEKWQVTTGSSITGSDKNFIEMKFRIDDPGSGAKYTANAYIDLNADGKYAEGEEIGGAAIRVYGGSSSDAVNRTELSPGTEYRIVCELNDSPTGVYPWKLQVTQNGEGFKYRRDGKVIYFLAPTGVRETIKVLQLKSGEHGSNAEYQSLDLKERMNNNNSILGKYLREARDFELNIDSEYTDYIFNNDSRSQVKVIDENRDGKFDDKEYLALFDKYDMLIIGFGDWYKWGSSNANSNKAAEALLQYIALGKSVLFCHDATSMYNYDGQWGYALNQYIRSIVGMNRYGVKTLAESVAETYARAGNTAIRDLLSNQKNDEIWEPGSRKNGKKQTLAKSQSHGLVYHSIMRFRDTGHWKMNTEDTTNHNSGSKQYLRHARLAGDRDADYTTVTIGKTTQVNVLNRGQITEYPYELPDSFPVKVTHAQYWQLNLDIDDDDDGETDVVVWYTLGDTDSNDRNRKIVYSGMGGDARNNYFIYNKGNVVYSGQGHWKFTTDGYDDLNGTANPNSEWESKLIVNTIIAAYANGTRASKVHFHETGSYTSRNITTDIIPFDALYDDDTLAWERDTAPMSTSTNLAGVYEGPTKTTYFEIDDTNVVDTKKIYAKFYKEDNASLNYNSETASDENLLHIKAVIPLTDDGVDATNDYCGPGGSLTKFENGEYLLYDSTDERHKKAKNAGRMFKLVYYLDSFDVSPSSNMATVTNTPGVRVVMRDVLQKRKNGTSSNTYSDDILPLIRTRMFDLK